MRYIKSITVLALLLTSTGIAAAQDPGRAEDERRQAAREYLEVQPVEEMMRDIVEKTTARMPGERKKMTLALMDEIRYDPLRTAMIDAMAATFTVEEIEALTQFYSTPEGRSVMKKMSTYMAEVQPVIMKEVRRSMQKVMQADQKEKR